jgi:serine/threonine-protein kinase
MSPEQLRSSSKVDMGTDVWSLGIVLYELLTGSLPFRGDDLPQVCTSVLTQPPIPLTTRCPDAPPELETVLMKCLEKNPDRRFRNVAELARELAPFGPPGAIARAERIVEVTRQAGDSFGPPSSVTGAAGFPSHAAQGHRQLATTDSRAVTTVITRAGRNAGRWAAVVLVAGVSCAAFLVGLGLRRSPAVHTTNSAAEPSPAAAPPVPKDPLPVEAPAPTQTAHSQESPPRSAEAISPHVKPGATPKPRAAAGAAVAPTPSPASNNRRAQFGERE